MVIATSYRNRRSAARAGLLLLGLLQQGESFEVFKKKGIQLIVFGLNTTNIRFSFTFRMKTETVGQQSHWIEPRGSGQLPNANVNLMRQRRPVSNSIFNWTSYIMASCKFSRSLGYFQALRWSHCRPYFSSNTDRAPRLKPGVPCFAGS